MSMISQPLSTTKLDSESEKSTPEDVVRGICWKRSEDKLIKYFYYKLFTNYTTYLYTTQYGKMLAG